MKLLSSVALLLIALVSASPKADIPNPPEVPNAPVAPGAPPSSSDSYVVALDDSNYDQFISDNKDKKILVEFYAPWCGHCKSLAPAYDSASVMLHDNGSSTKLVKVDATVATKTADRFEVTGYPTLKYYSNGKYTEYNGPRDAKGIYQWLLRREKVNFARISKPEECNKEGKSCVIAYVHNPQREKVFQHIANALIDEPESFSLISIPAGQEEKIEIFRSHFTKDPLTVTYPHGGWTVANIKAFMTDARYATIQSDSHFTPALYLYSLDRSSLIIALRPTDDEEAVRSELYPILRKHPKIHAVTVYPHKNESAKKGLDFFGVNTNSDKIGLFINDKHYMAGVPAGKNKGNNSMKFLSEVDKIDAEVVDKFLEDWAKGSLSQFFKTQSAAEMAESNTFSSNVQLLSGSNFIPNVLEKRDVNTIVMYHAPWCGHCKELKPTWNRLSNLVTVKYPTKKVVVAAMDATANDLLETDVKGFPTIILYPAGTSKLRDAIRYSGERKFEDLVEFIEDNAADLDDEDSKYINPKTFRDEL